MNIEEKKELMQSMAEMMKGAQVGQMVMFAESGSKIVYKEVEPETKKEVKVEDLVESADKVRSYFWSDSSMAVIFCVCRDFFNYADNMSKFERDFHCPEGLLSNTFRNNPYMRLPIEKWEQNGVKERVLKLADAYKKAVNMMVQE